jgi:hypothetical protein
VLRSGVSIGRGRGGVLGGLEVNVDALLHLLVEARVSPVSDSESHDAGVAEKGTAAPFFCVARACGEGRGGV